MKKKAFTLIIASYCLIVCALAECDAVTLSQTNEWIVEQAYNQNTGELYCRVVTVFMSICKPFCQWVATIHIDKKRSVLIQLNLVQIPGAEWMNIEDTAAKNSAKKESIV